MGVSPSLHNWHDVAFKIGYHTIRHTTVVVSACGYGLLTVKVDNGAPHLGLNHMSVYIGATKSKHLGQ